MNLVIDTSIALAAYFHDERYHDSAKLMLARLPVFPGVVPSLFWSEVRNGLLVAERRGRIEEGSWETYLGYLRRLEVAVDTEQVDQDVLSIASRHGLTAYDAEYLETAIRTNAQLMTFDKKLLAAARSEGIAADVHGNPTTG